MIKDWTQSDVKFSKNDGSNGTKVNEKGGQLYRKLRIKFIFGEKLDQLYVKVSLELNVIETTQFFLQKEGVNQFMMRHKIRTYSVRKSQKWGSLPWNHHTMPKYGSTLPGMLPV